MTRKVHFLYLLTCFLFLSSCTESDTLRIANDYFDTYRQRTDYEKFISFYDDEAVLEDIINGDRIIGKESIKTFFNWDHPDYSRRAEKALILESLLIKGDLAVAKGYFTAFSWKSSTFGPMHFTILLSFNQDGKIIKQVDWINYPASLVDYNQRNDSNDWIGKIE